MNNKNKQNERLNEMHQAQLEKVSAVKRSLYDKGFWVPQAKKQDSFMVRIMEQNRKSAEIALRNLLNDPLRH
jgi:hypothetical protein